MYLYLYELRRLTIDQWIAAVVHRVTGRMESGGEQQEEIGEYLLSL